MSTHARPAAERIETVIVGGGVAGLGCARALHRAGREFKLGSDRLGGRLHTGPTGLNLGAAYATSDYRHVLGFVERGPRILMKDCHFWDGRGYSTLFRPSTVFQLPALARLYRLVFAFRRRILRLREQVPEICQRTLVERDPVLRRYLGQPAAELVREHGLEELNRVYCAPIFWSTLFVPWHRANAFYYLANLFPICLPTYAIDATGAVDRLVAGYRARIVSARVEAIEELEGGARFQVEAAGLRLRCQNLVLALPARNATPLLPHAFSEPVENVPFCTLHIEGERRRDCCPGKTVFLGEGRPVTILWPQPSGVDIAFGPELEPDLSAFYTRYRIIDRVAWRTAVQLSGAVWRPLQPRPNLFTIGDHNLCGLEDSYLTGLFAANRISGRAAR
jgi:hypothetical protein